MADNNSNYRDLLIATEQKAQEHYDKSVIILSGGALAITLSLFKELSNSESFVAHHNWLFIAWIMWVCSVAATLFSHFFSIIALRYCIFHFDRGDTTKRPGGYYAIVMNVLTVLGGILFLAGVISMSFFIYNLMEGDHAAMKKNQIVNQSYSINAVSNTTKLEEGHRIPPPPKTLTKDGYRPPPPPPPPAESEKGLRPPPPPPTPPPQKP